MMCKYQSNDSSILLSITYCFLFCCCFDYLLCYVIVIVDMNYVLVKQNNYWTFSMNKLLRVLCNFAWITCVFVSQIMIDNYFSFYHFTPYVTSLSPSMSSHGTHGLKNNIPLRHSTQMTNTVAYCSAVVTKLTEYIWCFLFILYLPPPTLFLPIQ